MKTPFKLSPTLVVLLVLFVATVFSAKAEGVLGGFKNASTIVGSGDLRIRTTIREQVAITKTNQVFANPSDSVTMKTVYGFALPEGAAVTMLRWRINGVWFAGTISAADTSDGSADGSGGSGQMSNFARHFGTNPFTFSFLEPLAPSQQLEVELTYIQLLTYEKGSVQYEFKLETLGGRRHEVSEWIVDLKSESPISNLSENPTLPNRITVDESHFMRSRTKIPVTFASLSADFSIAYDGVRLNVLSCKPDGEDGYAIMTAVPGDNLGGDVVLAKRFMFIMDRSGSMSGSKIEQARESAKYCIQRLNPGDEFNVMAFSSGMTLWSDGYVEANAESMLSAETWVSNITHGGGTNIMGAMLLALQSMSQDDFVNVIVFITDGHAPVVQSQLVSANTADARTFVVGIGSGVDENALQTIADATNGSVDLVTSFADIATRIAAVYDRLRDPLVRNPVVSFSPDVMYDVTPEKLTDVYAGEQLTLSGRYNTPGEVTMKIEGLNKLDAATLSFSGLLVGAANVNTFVPKMWAQLKIQKLLKQYASATGEAKKALKEEIRNLGIKFGIVTPFTEFVDTGTEDDDEDDNSDVTSVDESEFLNILEHVTVAPNPIQTSAQIRFDLHGYDRSHVRLEIVDVLGRVIAVLYDQDWAPEMLELTWEALDASGHPLTNGQYFLLVTTGGERSTVLLNIAR